MKSVRAKAIKTGKMDTARFSLKRWLKIDLDTVAKIYKETLDRINAKERAKREVEEKKTKERVKRKPPTRKVNDEGIVTPKKTHTLKDLVKLGSDNHITWVGHIPEELSDVEDQIQAVFNVKKEAKSYSLKIWPPRKKSVPPKEYSIPKAPPTTAIRVVTTVGGRECFEISATAGSVDASDKIACFSGEAFSIQIGVSSAIECTFNNKTAAFLEARKGHRRTKIKKDPTKNYILVFDGSVNTSILVEKIKEEASKLARGNADVAQELASKTRAAMGIRSVLDSLEDLEEDEDCKDEEEPPELIPDGDLEE